MIGNFILSEIGVFMYFALSKAEKHAPLGEFVGTTDCITL